MNTKHKVHIYNKCSAQFKTSRKMLMQLAECQERGKKDMLYCDDCGFSCKTKSDLAHEFF